MPDLLQIGGATDEMNARVSAAFTIHKASDHADLTAWLAENGDKRTHGQTNGHDGVKTESVGGFLLGPDVTLRSGIFTHQNSNQAGSNVVFLLQHFHFIFECGADLFGDLCAF